jgi:uncharacterized membrane protein YtjA (UPF0391 family)
MLKLAIVFLLMAVIAGVLVLAGIEVVSALALQALFGVFLLGLIVIVAVGFFLGSWSPWR